MKTLTLLLGLLLASAIFSQNDSIRTFGLPEMKIKQKENGKVVTYLFENSLNKFTLTPSQLLPDTNRYNYKVILSDIQQVHFRNGTNLWNAAGIVGSVGFVLGFLAWGFFDFGSKPTFHINQAIPGGLITAVPFALIGGIFGALSSNFDQYSLVKMNEREKYEALMRLFNKYREKR